MDSDKRIIILVEARLVLGRLVYNRTLAARMWIFIFSVLWFAWLLFTRDAYSARENLVRIVVFLPIIAAHWHLTKLKHVLEILYSRHQLTGDLNDAKNDMQLQEEEYFGERNPDDS